MTFPNTGDMKLPAKVQEAMQMQVEAERKKRAAILESEGKVLFKKKTTGCGYE